jgi:hypothetical protein
LELTMNIATDQLEAPAAIRTNLGAIFVSLELSRSRWLISRYRQVVERRCRSMRCLAAM